jgi:hypothetical protein
MWALDDVMGRSVPCDQVGATMVEAATTSQGMPGPTENFLCGLAQGQSEGFVPGAYDVGFTLTSTSGNLGTAPVQSGVTIVGGQNTQLQPITFTIDATGNMALTLSTGMTSNCTGSPRAMQTVSISVDHTPNNTCAPMTLDIAAGAGTPASTYMNDCTMMKHACIENDQTIAASLPVVSGRYAFTVRGQISNVNCWAADVVVTVPPLGTVVTQTIPLSYSMLAGCP